MYIKIKLFIVSIACLIFSSIVFFWYFNNSEFKERDEKIAQCKQILKSGEKVKVTFDDKFTVATYENKPFGYSCDFSYTANGKKYLKTLNINSVSELAKYKSYDSLFIDKYNNDIYSFNPQEEISKNIAELNSPKVNQSFPWFYLILFIGSLFGIYFSIKLIKR